MTHSNKDYIYSQQPLWGSWNIEKLIGQGSFAKVYKLAKEEFGYTYNSALKVLTFPTKEMLHSLTSLSISKEQYFEDSIQDIISEIRLLYQLKGNSNIVAYEDHLVIKRDNEFLFDILIRMEYLKPFSKYLKETILTPKIIINLGMDICSAIDVCMTKNIIHRDIKEDNIFVTNDSKFKLGDFGVSKQLSELLLASTKIGTPLYVAPEVLRNQDYDSRADIYSLGIVLYKLFNSGRFPFMPSYPTKLKFSDTEIALNSRLSGKSLDEPYPNSKELSASILKACSFDPNERYNNASEFKKDLFQSLRNMDDSMQNTPITESPDTINEKDNNKHPQKNQPKTYCETVLIEHNTYKQEVKNYVNINENSLNILNGGFSFKYNDSYYISNIYNSFKLLKYDNDFNNPIVILEDHPSFINIYDDIIYCSNGIDSESLYKYNLNNFEKCKLSQDQIWDLHFFENYLYYINGSDNFSIHRIKPNGGDSEQICSHKSAFLNHNNTNALYFSNIDDNNSIYSISLDDSNRQKKIVASSSSQIRTQNSLIYYINDDDNFSLYSHNLNNSNNSKLLTCKVKNFCINEHSIFYINENNNIYEVDLNGQNNTLISDSFCKNIQLFSDYLLYYEEIPSKALYVYNIKSKNAKELIDNNPCSEILKNDWLYLQKHN